MKCMQIDQEGTGTNAYNGGALPPPSNPWKQEEGVGEGIWVGLVIDGWGNSECVFCFCQMPIFPHSA